MKYALGDRHVKTDGDDYWIAPGAQVMGEVTLGAGANIWFGTVVRGDNDPITIGAGCNVQDGCILHADPGFPMTVGENVSVGHNAMLHGCTVGDGSLIGIGAVVLNGAKVGRGCLIGANALVTEGMDIPDGSLVLGSPAKIKSRLSAEQQEGLLLNASHYVNNGQRYSVELKEQQ